MDNVIAALVGVGATALIGLIGWIVMRIFIRPMDQQTLTNQAQAKENIRTREQVAVLRHLLTQAILRIEWLEELHTSRNHPHHEARKRPPLEKPKWKEE